MKVPILCALVVALSQIGCAQPQSNQSMSRSMSEGPALEEAISNEDFRQITSVLVSVDGERIYENYWGDGTVSALNDTRSAMKTLTALAMGAAIEDGYVPSVEAKAVKWFEAERPYRFSTDLKDDISIRDLLTMSAAFDCDDNVWESPGNEEHMHPARNWTYFVLDLPTKVKYERDASGYGPFVYCTINSFLMGQIIERASGERVDHYIDRRLLSPIGIENIRWHNSPSGEIMTGGGAELSSRDLLKLGELILNQGRFNETQLLAADWINEMTRVHRSANDRQDYGYQIWREDFRCGNGTQSAWYMGGNGGNKIAIFPNLNLVAVVTATLYGTRGMHQQSTDILEQYVLTSLDQCKR